MGREKVATEYLDIKRLELGVFTPRMGIDEKWVEELAEDIRRNGQQKPIICRVGANKAVYQVVDGEHRVRAIKRLGLNKVRADVRELTDEEATFLAMRINELHGKHLNDFERGKQMFGLQERFGWTQEKLGETFGRSQPWVSDRIKLYLRASAPLKNNIITHVIDVSKARVIADFPEDEQGKVVKKVLDEGLSTKETMLLTHVLKKSGKEEREKILQKPIKFIAEAYGERYFEQTVKTPMETPIIEWFECPSCGRRLMVNWVEHTIQWKASELPS